MIYQQPGGRLGCLVSRLPQLAASRAVSVLETSKLCCQLWGFAPRVYVKCWLAFSGCFALAGCVLKSGMIVL